MKKVLSIVAALFLSIGAWAATGLSYRMVVTATGEVSVASQTSQSLENYAAFIGGSAEIYNGQSSDAKVIQSGCVRLTNSNGYVHVSLNRVLAAGDIIRYENGSKDTNKMFITTTATRSAGCEINPATDYIVDSKLVGATELYFWYGQSVNTTTYMTKLEVTTASPEVVFYDFSAETVQTISGATTLVNGMAVGNCTDDKVVEMSKDGFTKAFYIAGNGSSRALTFHVTDPCTIEVWAASNSGTARNIFLSEGSYSQTASATCADVFGGTVDNASVHYGTYTYTGLEDDKTMYLSANGGVNIFAVRVVYNKVRPVADLALKIDGVEKAEYDLEPNQSVVVNVASTSTVEPTRARGEYVDVLNIKNATDMRSFTVTAKKNITGDYTMIIRQAASADYRAAEKQIVFHVSNQSDATIARNTGAISDGSKVWSSTSGQITLIDEKADADANCIRPVSNKQDLLLAKGHTYTISVPSNQRIVSAQIVGFTSGTSGNKAKIKVNNVTSEELPYSDATEAGTINYDNINASKFVFSPTIASVNLQVNLVLATNDYFPVIISNGYATFCAAEDVILPSCLTAYVATGSTADEILLEEIADGVVEANTGVVLMGEDGNYNLTITSGASALSSVLNGTVKRIANPGSVYCLNSEEGAFQQYNGAYIPANKAYFTAPAGAPARMAMRIGHVVTGLENVNDNDNANKVLRDGQILIVRGEKMYNLQGQLVK